MKNQVKTPLQKLAPLDLIKYFEDSCRLRIAPFEIELGGVIYGYNSLKNELIERLLKNHETH